MKKKQVVDLYCELLGPELKKYAFSSNKSDMAFTRKTDNGFDRIRLSIVSYGNLGEHWVDFIFQMRNNEVQSLVNYPLKVNPKAFGKTVTLNTRIKELLQVDTFVDIVKTEADIQKSAKRFFNIFVSKGVGYFEHYSSLENLFVIFETIPDKAWNYFGPYGWYYSVIAVAWLYDKQNFPTFREAFYQYLSKRGFSEQDLQDIKSFVRDYLD